MFLCGTFLFGASRFIGGNHRFQIIDIGESNPTL
jgi:hypothetical protein